MRFSRVYIPTLKEAPADAEVISHKLLVRAGMIRKLTSGVYNYLPLGIKAMSKISAIVREEMDKSGGQEILMPAIQPADLWKESGRWDLYGKELFRLQDRHNRHCCLGPTHEEVITDLIRGELRSYRQFPVILYQIQTKFRDEIRPRFGLMRGREFVMKDAYSFDVDDKGADTSYWTMYDAYKRIFSRLGLNFSAVEADSGAIGGSFSHEFMVLAETGEDYIAVCQSCGYAANLERAEIKQDLNTNKETEIENYAEVSTPKKHSVVDVANFLKVTEQDVIKTIILDVDGKPVAVLVRGDRDVNLIKVKNHLNATEVNMASPQQVLAWVGIMPGFVGPVGLHLPKIIADLELQSTDGWVTGANKDDTHLINVSLKRDVDISSYADLRNVIAGDSCPKCGKEIIIQKGIEVGHVFKLGTKYSAAMNANFVKESGEETPIVMGCYGIGVSRILAACIEQNNDEQGIIFPPQISPYEVILLNLDVADEKVTEKAEFLYSWIQQMGIDVLYDDRVERAGVKFKDADLMGMPMQVIIGSKGLSNGFIEVKDRRTGDKSTINLDNLEQEFANWREDVLIGWDYKSKKKEL